MDCSLCPWNSPGKITGDYSLLQEIFLTQELNLGVLQCRQFLYDLIHQGIHTFKSSNTVDLNFLIGSFFFFFLNTSVSSVHFLSRVRFFVTPWPAAHQSSLFITNSRNLFKLMSIELVVPSNHHILCHPFLLLPSIFPSIRVFSNESVLHKRWPKYWSFSFSISASNEYSGLISIRIDWLALFALQGTLKSLLQHHNSKASILQCSAFFIV